jgi:hypothetical protein
MSTICVCWGGATFTQVSGPLRRIFEGQLFAHAVAEAISHSGQIDELPTVPRVAEIEWSMHSASISGVNISQNSGSPLLSICGPHFQGSSRDGYMCVLEVSEELYGDEALACYSECKRSDATFVSLSIDEIPDLENSVSEANFPWDFFGLRIGAVRLRDGEWVEREGPASEHGNTVLVKEPKRE